MVFKERTLQSFTQWFKVNKRSFPWRENTSPYEVWVSEVMLQQTQASVVISYYLAWMKEFPNIDSLAQAPLEQVLKVWEGLGYYSRARRLHEAAKIISQQHGGILPKDENTLKTIPGIGPYTLGAIRSFAFHQKAAAVDGNVMRVLSRFLCIEEDISSLKVQKKIREYMYDLLPKNTP
jgi:A/G-specific adenine glycosylase